MAGVTCSKCGRSMNPSGEHGWYAYAPKVLVEGALLDVRCPECLPATMVVDDDEGLLIAGEPTLVSGEPAR